MNHFRAEIVNYYDNYDYLATEMFKESDWQQKMASASGACAVGLPTGSMVRTSNGEFLYGSVYYDAKGRAVRTFGTHLGGGMQETRTSYTFTNNPKVVSTTEYNANGDVEGSAEYTYAYNQYNDKLQSIDLRMNGEESAHRIAENTYDDLGRLLKVRRSGSAGDVDYAYNIRNWVTSISSREFSETLHYTDGIGTPCYNGNISSMQWQNGASSPKSGYKFSYDGLNRLTSAIYGEGDDMSQNADRFSENGITYNANGSIYRMKRYGMLNDGSYGLVDDLRIKLDGNALYGITDYAAETNYKGSANFVDADGSGQEYWFNGNGSLSADANKGIARIDYDNYGCPRKIVFTNGNTTEYVYSSTGEKLRTTHKTAIDGITVALNGKDNLKDSDFLSEDKTDYHGCFIYENDKLDKVLYQGGYVQNDSICAGSLGKPRGFAHTDNTSLNILEQVYVYHYYTQDHLGNNRAVIDEGGNVKQVTNYYPFGGVFSTTAYNHGDDLQPYKYTGKELDRTHGLDWYDYGARNYDAFLPMFTSIDPLCEKYYHISPYAYCANNPMRFIDPDGKQPVKRRDADGTIRITWNIVVLNKALKPNASERSVRRHERQKEENKARLLDQFNRYLNGDGNGVKNSKGETVISEFNIMVIDVENPSDKIEAKKQSKSNAQEIKEGQAGNGDAAVFMEGSTGGNFGLTTGACYITIALDAPEGTEAHELYHTTGVGDNGYQQGGILNSPAEPIKPEEVDEMLKLIPEAK